MRVFFNKVLCSLLIFANVMFGVPVSLGANDQPLVESPQLMQVDKDINNQVSSYYRRQQNQLSLSSQQLGLQGPVSIGINYDGLTKNYFLGAKWAQLISQDLGFSALGEYNPNRYRLSATLGIQPIEDFFIKGSIEQLSEVLPFNFTTGNASQLVRQNAYGAEAQYTLGNSIFKDLNAGIYYAKAPNVTLSVISLGPLVSMRNIAGATSWGSDIGTDILLDCRTSIGATLNYDKVFYNTIFSSSSQYNASGLGGSISLNHIISDKWMFIGKAEARKIYDDYSVTVSWLPPIPSFMGVELSLTGQRTVSHNQMPTSTLIGFGLKFSLGDKKANENSYHTVNSLHAGELNSYIATPAVYMNRVLAVSEEVTRAASPIRQDVKLSVSSVSPNISLLSGGTQAKLEGTGLSKVTKILFGATPAQITKISDTSVEVIVPAAQSSGAVDIIVEDTENQTATLTSSFRYLAKKFLAPTISTISPASGLPVGGTVVTITGNGFKAGAMVKFGENVLTSVTVDNPTQLTVITPAHALGLVDVVVANTNAQSVIKHSAFRYANEIPSISTVNPMVGNPSGGSIVTIIGTGFVNGATVKFGTSAASNVTVYNATTITAVAPAHALGPVDVVVTNPNTQTATMQAGFVYLSGPTITRVSPAAGALGGGSVVTITGTGFLSDASVQFGLNPATSVTVDSATQITAVTPAGSAGTVAVKVTNVDSQSTSKPNSFTYQSAPTISTITPNRGALAGGNNITVTGTGFLAGATLAVGGTAATNVNVVNATTITATTPVHAAGSVDVVVTNPDTQTGTMSNGFIYEAAPTVTSVTPSIGALAGGTNITISGSGFIAGATVSVGGSTATNVNVVNANTITATTSAHVAGTVDIVVSNIDSQTGTRTNAFTYNPLPTITTVSPIGGPLAGGNTVTINGTGFISGATVKFGGVSSSGVTFVSATQLTAVAPAGTNSVSVQVTNPDTQSVTKLNGYSYANAPTITSITPFGGPPGGGNAVTINGTGFINGATVKFGGVSSSSVSFVSASQLTAVAPVGTGRVSIQVTNPDTQTGDSGYIYQYAAPPTINSVSPNGGALLGGTVVTIMGTNFDNSSGTPTVTFGATQATDVIYISSTQLSVKTPAHSASAVNVVVTNADTQFATATSAFTYRDAPTITNVAPSGGAPGGANTVTITGTGFISGAKVYFGSTEASVTFNNAAQLTVVVPAGSGQVTVRVVNPDNQQGIWGSLYTYALAPVILYALPTGGPIAGGNSVTIGGVGFNTAGTTTVKFGSSSASAVQVINSGLLSVTAPASPLGGGGAGSVNIQVTNPDSQVSGTLSYTYGNAPTVTGVVPAGGIPAGGTIVTITGTGFYGTPTVTFGGQPAASVTRNSATQITATTPAHVAGLVNVVVTNPDSQSGFIQGYTYQAAPTITLPLSTVDGSTLGGDVVTINGSGFLPGASVSFGGSPAVVISVSSTSIQVITTAHAPGLVEITVTNTDGQSDTTSSFPFKYNDVLTITSVGSEISTPSGYPGGALGGGTLVMITGTGFDGIMGTPTVTFGGAAATYVNSDPSGTWIEVLTPAHLAGAVNVVVTNPGGLSVTSTGAYTYEAGPNVTSVFNLNITCDPTEGLVTGGDSLVISGNGFNNPTVLIGGASATVSGYNSTEINVTTPPASFGLGLVDVTVVNQDGQQSIMFNGFDYVVSCF